MGGHDPSGARRVQDRDLAARDGFRRCTASHESSVWAVRSDSNQPRSRPCRGRGRRGGHLDTRRCRRHASDMELVAVRLHDRTGNGLGLAELPIGGSSRRVTCSATTAIASSASSSSSGRAAWRPLLRKSLASSDGGRSFAQPCGLSRTIGSTGGGLMCSASERGSAVGGCIMSSSSRARFLQPVASR